MPAQNSAKSGRNNSRRIWIVNHYAAAPHKTGSGGRHYFLGKSLKAQGWSTTQIGSTTMHPTGEQAFNDFKLVRQITEDGVDCLWVWSNSYKSGGSARVVGMAVFALAVLTPRSTRPSPAPDIVIGSTVHLLAAWAALHLSRRHNAAFVYEVRDLWPETLIDLGALKPGGLVSRAIKRLSLSLARSASLVISPLPGVGKYLLENNIDTPFMWAANGTDESLDSHFYPSPECVDKPFTFMYLGSHGRANALESLLKAFDQVCNLIPETDFIFRLVGSGPEKRSLQNLADSLTNGDRIYFENPIPRQEVNGRARESDCLLVNLLDRPVYRYGISLNKLFDYLLAERPIIIASNALNNPVKEARAGISVPADDVNSLAIAMEEMYRMSPESREDMGLRGKQHVLQEYSYAMIANKLSQAFEKLI